MKMFIQIATALAAALLLCLGASGNARQALPYMGRARRRRMGVSPARLKAFIDSGGSIAGGDGTAPTLIACDACGSDVEEAKKDQHVCPTNDDDVLARIEGHLDKLDAAGEIDVEKIRDEAVAEVTAKIASGELTIETPSRKESRHVEIRDRFDQMGWQDGDEELAMMLFEATWKMRNPSRAVPPEDLVRRWRSKAIARIEAEDPLTIVEAETGKFQRTLNIGEVEDYTTAERYARAMDSAETGFGLELIGAQYINQLWEAARNEDSLVGDIRQIPMTDKDTYIPIDGALPEMLFVGESTAAPDDWSNAPATSKSGSNRRQLAAKKFTIQQVWSSELQEDSIIAFVPFLREKLGQSVAAHLGSAYYNGDTTNAGTGNINSDDADPTDTKHYLAFDGIRHYWLVDTAGQGVDQAGALNPEEIWKARGRLSGQGNDIDAEVKTINWGKMARELRLVCDFDTFMILHRLGEVLTVDKYGPQATVISGELGSYAGIPIISPPYASKTEADGKASGTEANNTKGQITLFNPRGFLAGVRRDVQFFLDRIQRTDQFLIELYMRVGFNRHGENVSSGIYNITV